MARLQLDNWHLDVERRLTVVLEIEKQINYSLRRADRLRQSILAEAFSGRLVGERYEEPEACPELLMAAEPDPSYGATR